MDDTLSIWILLIEFGAFHTIRPGHVAGLAPAITIFLAYALGNELVLDTMSWILNTLSPLQAIVLDARTAVAGEIAL